MNNHLTKVVYTPDSAITHPAKMLHAMWLDIVRGRGLALRLARRDINSQYRQAFLGILWALILPLANTVAWVFLNSSGIISVDKTTLPYHVYVFTGTMLWSIFMDALNAPLLQASAAQTMLSKINFPREALIMSGILQTLFNGGIKIMLLLVALILSGVYPDWHLLLFPFSVLSLILAGTTIGLLITPIGLLYTDIGKGISMVMQFLMFVTPVVFTMPTSGWAMKIYECNPLTSLIVTARNWLTGYQSDYLGQFLVINMLLFMLLLVVAVIYRLTMPILIERMGS